MIRRTTFRQLQIFCAVARSASFVRAADEMHLTQPAVSMQIKQLEHVLGIELIERHGKRLDLTEAGGLFLEHASRVLGELHDAEETLNQLKGLRGGQVTVGMVSTAKYFVPRLLARFAASYPKLDLRILTGNRDDLIGTLRRNEIDLAIMGRPPRGLELVTEAFATHPYVFVAPPDHRLAKERGIDLFDLRDETMLLRESGSGTRILNEEYFTKCLFTPKRSIEMGSNETIKQAIMAGMGLSLMSKHTLSLEMKHALLAVLDVAGTPIVRNWHVAYTTHRRLSPAATAMRRFILDEGAAFLVGEFGRDGPRHRASPSELKKVPAPMKEQALKKVAKKKATATKKAAATKQTKLPKKQAP